MAESFGSGFTIVEVIPDNGLSKRQLWVALANPSQALPMVLSAVPEGWIADVVNDRLTYGQLDALENLKLKPGEVRQLTK
jgi:hypothetical protein